MQLVALLILITSMTSCSLFTPKPYVENQGQNTEDNGQKTKQKPAVEQLSR